MSPPSDESTRLSVSSPSVHERPLSETSRPSPSVLPKSSSTLPRDPQTLTVSRRRMSSSVSPSLTVKEILLLQSCIFSASQQQKFPSSSCFLLTHPASSISLLCLPSTLTVIQMPDASIQVCCKGDPCEIANPNRACSFVHFEPDVSNDVFQQRYALPLGNQEGDVDPQSSDIKEGESRSAITKEERRPR